VQNKEYYNLRRRINLLANKTRTPERLALFRELTGKLEAMREERRRIVNTTVELVLEQDAKALSPVVIAKECELKKPTLYYVFGKKRIGDLYTDAYRELLRRELEIIESGDLSCSKLPLIRNIEAKIGAFETEETAALAKAIATMPDYAKFEYLMQLVPGQSVAW
jgi:AcrR family transcriptional regulator